LRRGGSGPDLATGRNSSPELPEGVETSRVSALPSPPVVPVDLSGTDLGPSLGLGRPVSGASVVWSPPKKKKSKGPGPLAAVIAVVVLGGASMVFQTPLRRAADGVRWPELRPAHPTQVAVPVPPPVPPPAEAVAPATAAASVANAEPDPSAAPGGAASASVQGAAADAPGVEQCATPQFAEGTFSGIDPDLSFLCSETDPRRGASRLKSEVVRASTGRKVTEGMKEWSVLGWYEMAAFAIIRRRCCAAPQPLSLPAPTGGCKPLDRALDDLGDAATTAGADLEAALGAYTKAIHCAVSSGHASTYGQQGRPRGGEETALRKTMGRRAPTSTPTPSTTTEPAASAMPAAPPPKPVATPTPTGASRKPSAATATGNPPPKKSPASAPVDPY
jgi:serine/threonine-protein kinase